MSYKKTTRNQRFPAARVNSRVAALRMADMDTIVLMHTLECGHDKQHGREERDHFSRMDKCRLCHKEAFETDYFKVWTECKICRETVTTIIEESLGGFCFTCDYTVRANGEEVFPEELRDAANFEGFDWRPNHLIPEDFYA